MMSTAVNHLVEPRVGLLNFVLVGEQRSGAGMLRLALNELAEIVCHVGLLDESVQARQQAHAAYFGDGEFFSPEVISPFQFLNHLVFDNPRHGETRIGVHLPYERVRRWELDDLFHEKYLDGDFCLLHVVRNPLACFVSQRQAELSGCWSWLAARKKPPYVPPVEIDPQALTQFVRNHEAMRQRLLRSVPDLIEIPYEELLNGYPYVMSEVMEFLELTPLKLSKFKAPSVKLHERPTRERISNWASLHRELPGDVRDCLEEAHRSAA